MDGRDDLSGPWFDEGEALSESDGGHLDAPQRPNLLGRFGLALAGAGVLVAILVTVARAFA